jgi:hypothetical protein
MIDKETYRLNATGRTRLEIIRASIIPARKVSEKLSWEHKMFIYFAKKNKPVNVADFIFDNLCKNINESIRDNVKFVRHPRLLSELFFQSGILEGLQKHVPTLVNDVLSPSCLIGKFLEKHMFIKQGVYPKDPIPMSKKNSKLLNHFLRVTVDEITLILLRCQQALKERQEFKKKDLESTVECSKSAKKAKTEDS